MKKSYAISFLVFAVLLLLSAKSADAAAYYIQVDLDKSGGGTGQVNFSATSSLDFEFSGWTDGSGEFSESSKFGGYGLFGESGESCLGKEDCVLRNLISNKSKRVVAGFNAPICTEFIYSEFGACQLDGTARRSVIAASPLGCVGGNPIITKGCFFDVCARAQTTTVEPSLWDRFKDFWSDPVKNSVDLGKGIISLVTGGGTGEVLPNVPPGGGKGGSEEFNVIRSDTTVTPIGTTPTISPIAPPAPFPEPDFVGGKDEPFIVTAPRYNEPEPDFNFQFDPNFGKDPATRCK